MFKKIIGVYLFLLGSFSVFGQEIIYSTGKVVDISSCIASSNRIRTIMDDNEEGISTYYLIQKDDGSDLVIDQEQVFYYDVGAPDFESEGYIRFRDKQTNLVGLYNDKGEIVLSPIYTSLSRVHNGVLYALSDAKVRNIGRGGDEHIVFEGGKTRLIKPDGTVLINEMLAPNVVLDMYSLSITEQPMQDERYMSLLGVNGKYYNFLNLESYFKRFVEEDFLPKSKGEEWLDFTNENTIVNIELNNGSIGDYEVGKGGVLLRKYEKKLKRLFKLVDQRRKDSIKFSYRVDNWGGYVDDGQIDIEDFGVYYNTTNEWREELFPMFELILKEENKGKYRNNHFDFFRDKKGELVLYRITLRSNYF
ncbi:MULTISPECIES: hypothetical protein [unclassified Myroides]|uniref:hypothetical protein n=1 Tax=unclassified Myroides TaxID=2642485 RepID=UPI003100E079